MVQGLRDRSLRLPNVLSALLLFGAAGILAMVVAFSVGGGGRLPVSSPPRPPAAGAIPSQVVTPAPPTPGPSGTVTQPPPSAPVCATPADHGKHHKRDQQSCVAPTAAPSPGNGNGD
jgi:hypothetical protein